MARVCANVGRGRGFGLTSSLRQCTVTCNLRRICPAQIFSWLTNHQQQAVATALLTCWPPSATPGVGAEAEEGLGMHHQERLVGAPSWLWGWSAQPPQENLLPKVQLLLLLLAVLAHSCNHCGSAACATRTHAGNAPCSMARIQGLGLPSLLLGCWRSTAVVFAPLIGNVKIMFCLIQGQTQRQGGEDAIKRLQRSSAQVITISQRNPCLPPHV